MTAPTDALRALANRVERLAFQMPAPNEWTPQFVEIAIAARSVLADYPMTEPRTMDAKGLRELLEKAIAEAEHKPGEWHVSALTFGAAAIRHPAEGGLVPFNETVIGTFPWKRDGWLAVAAVNALPALLSELDRLRGEVAGLPAEPTPEMQAAHTMYGDTSDWWPTLLAAIKESANGQAATLAPDTPGGSE